MDAPRPSGKPLRFVTRATLFEALDGALEASLADGALTCGERQRARRRATQAFVVRLRTGSRRVRALSRDRRRAVRR